MGDMITDRNLLLGTIYHTKSHRQEKKIVTRKLRSINLPSSTENIVQGLRVNDSSESVLDLLNRYNGHLTIVLNQQACTKEREVYSSSILQSWFTDELHQGQNERRKAERLWRRTGLTVHKEIYRAEKFKYNTSLLDSKATYFNERITECGNDAKAISKIIDDPFLQKMTRLPAYIVLLQTSSFK